MCVCVCGGGGGGGGGGGVKLPVKPYTNTLATGTPLSCTSVVGQSALLRISVVGMSLSEYSSSRSNTYAWIGQHSKQRIDY